MGEYLTGAVSRLALLFLTLGNMAKFCFEKLKKDTIKSKILSKTRLDLEQGGMMSKSLNLSYKNMHLCHG